MKGVDSDPFKKCCHVYLHDRDWVPKEEAYKLLVEIVSVNIRNCIRIVSQSDSVERDTIIENIKKEYGLS